MANRAAAKLIARLIYKLLTWPGSLLYVVRKHKYDNVTSSPFYNGSMSFSSYVSLHGYLHRIRTQQVALLSNNLLLLLLLLSLLSHYTGLRVLHSVRVKTSPSVDPSLPFLFFPFSPRWDRKKKGEGSFLDLIRGLCRDRRLNRNEKDITFEQTRSDYSNRVLMRDPSAFFFHVSLLRPKSSWVFLEKLEQRRKTMICAAII